MFGWQVYAPEDRDEFLPPCPGWLRLHERLSFRRLSRVRRLDPGPPGGLPAAAILDDDSEVGGSG